MVTVLFAGTSSLVMTPPWMTLMNGAADATSTSTVPPADAVVGALIGPWAFASEAKLAISSRIRIGVGMVRLRGEGTEDGSSAGLRVLSMSGVAGGAQAEITQRSACRAAAGLRRSCRSGWAWRLDAHLRMGASPAVGDLVFPSRREVCPSAVRAGQLAVPR